MIIIIATLIIQSFILSLYYGVTQGSEHYYLLLDFLLLLGFGSQQILLLVLIGSLCLQNEILDFDSELKQYYLSMRLILSYNILLGKQKVIYFIFALSYLLFRYHYYLFPTSYLSIIGYSILLFQTYFQGKKKNTDLKTEQIFQFFSQCLPLSLCIIQEEQFTFLTQQFKTEYKCLTPQIIKNITSKSTKECLSTYLIKKKLSKNQYYQYYNQKKLENCTLDENLEDLFNLFPSDIEIAEVIWKQEPAIMLIFQRQEEKQQLKNIEDLKKRDQYKDILLTNVSHDFKAPIGGILAIVQYLEQIIEDQSAIDLLIVLKKWAHLLLFNISDIQDFSRIQQNTLRLTNTTFFIKSLVQEMIDLISIQAKQKGIIVEKNILFDDRLMYSDPNRIKQILLNLLSNSLKFTEKGKINIIVDYKYKEQDESEGKLITISVADTGVGIPEHIKPLLFKMYGTFDLTKNGSNQHGTGLGLVICKQLVGLLGPTDNIELVSKVGVGSKFSFDIFINNDQRNQNSFAQRTNFFKSESKKNDQIASDQLISSNFTIFQKTTETSQGLSYNQKKLNKKGIQTSYDIPDRRYPNSAQYFRSLPRRKTLKKSMLKKEIINNNVISFNIEDSDNSKSRNIEYYLELNNEVTYGSQKNKIITENTSQLNTPIQRNDSSESPVVQRRECKPQQFTESIDDMMKKLFPKPCFILVVDDSPVNVFAFKLILQRYNQIIIDEAFNGQKAIQLIENKAKNKLGYQFIFMDLTMPIMNGYEATEQIRIMESNKLIERNYIIALTGYDDMKQKEKCYRLGFDAFVSKPIQIVDIISVVNEVRNNK